MNRYEMSCGPDEIGPQFPKDPPFTARMRFQQSWYRSRVLKAPCGTGPRPSNRTLYGNMLTPADGDRGLNFLARHILTVARRRMAEKKGLVDPFRLLCNLLSNQALAFNLFGLLVDDRELAERLLPALIPGEPGRRKVLELLWTPPRPHELLNDPTGYDALAEYQLADKRTGFVGIETRLAEPGPGLTARRPEALRWLDAPGAPWLPGAGERLLDPRLSPLFRGHLLAEALLRREGSKYAAGQFLLLYHPDDAETEQAVQEYQALLKPGTETFRAMPMSEIVDRWQASGGEQAGWLEGFRRRYLDLALSEEEWQNR